jgi:superfamily II DNA or RNA helicase
MIKLRDYQQRCVQSLHDSFASGHRFPVLVAPTGSGKTVMFSAIALESLGNGWSVLAVVHRRELVRQISATFLKFGIAHEIIRPGHYPNLSRTRVAVGSVQTLARRKDVVDKLVCNGGGRLLMIFDEVHHVTEQSQWGRIIDGRALCLGVTATPQRLDGRGLGKGFGGFADDLLLGPSPAELMAGGYLSGYRIFSAPQSRIDVAGLRTGSGGDYVASELSKRTGRAKIYGDAVAEWRRHAAGMRSVIFCSGVANSIATAEAFNAAGIPAEHIDGQMPTQDRDAILQRYAQGTTLALTNVGIVSEGFDLASVSGSDVTVDCIVDLSPTKSLAMALQRWGRCLRPRDGKACAVILDLAGNALRHGLPDDPREWSLDGTDRKKSAAPRIQICPECFAVHRPAARCPVCGHSYAAERDGANIRNVTTEAGELVEITDKVRFRDQVRKFRTLEDLKKFGAAKGYKPGWAQRYYDARRRKYDERS